MTSDTSGGATPVPAHTSGPGNTVVLYGDEGAAHVLGVYLDPRCPYCKRMENGLGTVIREAADAGRFRVEYHFATFLDDAGGSGSLHALAALGAALDEGSGPFALYLRLLYAEQPPEGEDGFADEETLLKLAGEVPGLATEAFTRKVSEGVYLPWARTVSAAFERTGVEATPTVLADGDPVAVLGPGGYAVTPEAFFAQLSERWG
ncbi:thioredoxin domain-containing protein [Streptomyces cinereoruber]|uniref:thioredoxin domain-containing protein n=1 Tax=Streptomyces cinereoruber TaxID=67260 RepID=UPI0036381374